MTRAATELDRVGSLLQVWTTTAVESAARVRAARAGLARSDLVIDGQLVVERSGPSRVEPGERLAERERLQELLNRVTTVQARASSPGSAASCETSHDLAPFRPRRCRHLTDADAGRRHRPRGAEPVH